VGFGVGVLGGGVDADQIARNQLEILQRERGRAVGLLFALFFGSRSTVVSGPPLTE
jgi:hypothetical protein